jgi:pilus assembly protein CpaF
MEKRFNIEVRREFEVQTELSFAYGSEVVVGRAVDADVVLDSREISRRHAVLIPTEGFITVRDLSSNGIICKEFPVQDGSELLHGSIIEIDPFTLRLGDPAPEEGREILRARRLILDRLIDHVDLNALSHNSKELRGRVEAALERIAHDVRLPDNIHMPRLIKALADEALGLGPLEELLDDDDVSEIMVVDKGTIFTERHGRIEQTGLSFSSEKAVRTAIERIITPLGRRIDEASPMVDARLPDGSRVNAIIPPLALRGACITIRKFTTKPLGINDLVSFGSMTQDIADFLCSAVRAHSNIVISGGTGSGKTTLLGVLGAAIPDAERIVTIEDAAELRLPQDHVVVLESRPPNAEDKGQISIRDLVRNALRMRPDRIVVGECRGGEALDMLQAMNTGHDGSLTTLHANSPAEAISRMETLCLMGGLDLPARSIREQIAQAIDLVVQQSRQTDGSRRITSIAEVTGMEDDGTVGLREIFKFVKNDTSSGEFMATGWLPTCLSGACR